MNCKQVNKHLFSAIAFVCMIAVADNHTLEPSKNEFKIISPVPSGSTVEMITQALEGVQIGDGDDGFSVSVKTFENLHYVLKRAANLGEEFVSVNDKDAESIGTGNSMTLIDASLDRPPDRAFYRVDVSIPSKQPSQ